MTVIRTKGPGAKVLDVMLKNLDGKVGKVGWMENSKYPTGTNVAHVAAIQEFGYAPKNIPPRPFMRPTIAEKQNEWRGIANQGSAQIVKGQSTVAKVMEMIGLKAAGDIRKKIASIWTPALSPRTIAARAARFTNKEKGRRVSEGRLVKGKNNFVSYDYDSKLGAGNIAKPLVDTKIMLNTLTNTVENG